MQETATASLRSAEVNKRNGTALTREPTLFTDTADGAVVTTVAIIRIVTAANHGVDL